MEKAKKWKEKKKTNKPRNREKTMLWEKQTIKRKTKIWRIQYLTQLTSG